MTDIVPSGWISTASLRTFALCFAFLAAAGCSRSNSDAADLPLVATTGPAFAADPIAYDIEDSAVIDGVEMLSESEQSEVLGSKLAETIAAKPIESGLNYISDLDWVSSRNDYGPVERDQSVGGTAANDGNKPMLINGASFSKGVGVHGESEVVIALDERCSAFTASVGINDYKGRYRINSRGSMRFQVWGDGELLRETGVVTGSTAAQRIDLNVATVTTLRLVTKNNGIPGRSVDSNYDHGNWANASVTCSGTSQPQEPAPVPVISSFISTPTSIEAGASATLRWSVTNATSVSIDPGVGAVTGTSRVVSPSASTTYTLTARNDSGAVSSQTSVVVTAAEPDPEPPAGEVSDAQAARFLNQATYGATSSDIARVKQLGYASWIDEQFGASRIDTHRDYLMRRGPRGCNPCSSEHINSVMESFWYQAARSPDQLRQRTVLALSEIFVVSALNSNGALETRADAHAGYHDMLARNAFGNFRTLLEEVATSPAMAHYLSHFKNEKEDPVTGRQPDENFAREIMQLFSVGLWQLDVDGTQRLENGKAIPTYDRRDVEGLAKVFTGWGFGGSYDWYTHYNTALAWYPQMKLYPEHHSSAEKKILNGVTIPAGTNGTQSMQIAMDTLFNHPNVGPFIGSQLIKRFVTSNPSNAYVRRVAQTFNDNGQGVRGDMRAVLRAVLLDPEARSEAKLADPTWGKVREPLVRFGHFMRAFSVNSQSGYFRLWNLEDPVSSLGQNPMRAPSVFNWFRPDYSPQGAVREAGLVAPEFQIVHEGTITSWINFISNSAAGRLPVDGQDTRDRLVPNFSRELALAADARQLVDHLNLVLAAGQLSSPTRTTIVDALDSIPSSSEQGRQSRVTAAITLVMSSPEYLVQK